MARVSTENVRQLIQITEEAESSSADAQRDGDAQLYSHIASCLRELLLCRERRGQLLCLEARCEEPCHRTECPLWPPHKHEGVGDGD